MELKLPTDSSEEYTELYGFDIYYECKEGEQKHYTLILVFFKFISALKIMMILSESI